MPTKNVVVICISLLIAGIAIWPGIFKYDHVKYGAQEIPIRVNRLTGYTEEYKDSKWTPAEGYERKVDATPLPPDQIAMITGTGGITPYGSFEGNLYNGSDWNVKRIIIQVNAWPIGRTKPLAWNILENEWSRKLEVDVDVDNHKTKDFSIRNIPGTQGMQFEWGVDSAYGTKD